MSITSFEHGDRTQWLTKDTGKLLLSQGFRSDFTIKCQDREWRVHQEIIGDRSDYFNVMLSRSQWKVCHALPIVTDYLLILPGNRRRMRRDDGRPA